MNDSSSSNPYSVGFFCVVGFGFFFVRENMGGRLLFDLSSHLCETMWRHMYALGRYWYRDMGGCYVTESTVGSMLMAVICAYGLMVRD